jgi:oligopeptide/dipeptide ABC transporter ATP-binding protein
VIGAPGLGSAAATGSAPNAPLLTVKDLRVTFNGERTVHAVRGLSYEIAPGERLGLVGESGSGKSVSTLALLGLLPAHSSKVTGSAVFGGHELIGASDRSLRAIRGAKVSMVFQDPLISLNPVLTIGRQITETLRVHTTLSKTEASERAIELLQVVGIAAPKRRVTAYPHELSGGMRQRAMIAMALSCQPALLIADEPTTALDVTVQAQILELLRRLRDEFGMATLLITHDMGVVAGFVDRLAVMYAGRIVEIGPTQQVLADPAHPYTVGLLRSLPRLDRPRQPELLSIEGAPPDLRTEPVGCPFRPRCAWAIDRCAQEDPQLEPGSPGRAHACWSPRHHEALVAGDREAV